MSKAPVNPSALLEMRALVREARKLIREGKLAEAENRISRLQATVCPFIVFA